MFIYQFNRLIRSRLLWGFFAIIISVAFVSVGSCGRAGSERPDVAGKLNGKNISIAAYNQGDFAVRGFGARRNTAMPAQVATRRIWEQLAALQVAAKAGLTAGKDDIREILRSENIFQGPNGFDFDRYRVILKSEGFASETQYEGLMGHHFLLEKIGMLISTAAWVSPMELDDELAAMTDTFRVQTATLSNRFVNVEMPLSDADYKAFYEENDASFRRPDRMSVRYMVIPASNYLARVTVPDDDLRDHYDAHIDRYRLADTNAVTSIKPFEDVKDAILAELQIDEALHCAETNVTFTIFGRLKTAADNALALLAAEEQVDVVTSPLFAQNEPLPWVSAAKEFATAAFDLEPESFETRLAVVKGKNEVFVMEYHQKSEAHIPAFEEVIEDVKTRAQGKARTEAFDKYVTEIRADICTLMEAGKTFGDAATETVQNVSTSLTYTASDMQTKPFENSYVIAYGARTLKKGDLSEAVPVSLTQSLLIYVEDRQQGDAFAAAMMRPQIRSSLEHRQSATRFNDWLKWNLDRQRLEPSPQFMLSTEEEEEPPDLNE